MSEVGSSPEPDEWLTYRVSWEIDVHADAPREAAEQALKIQRNPASIATVFQVVGPDGNAQSVDLLADD